MCARCLAIAVEELLHEERGDSTDLSRLRPPLGPLISLPLEQSRRTEVMERAHQEFVIPRPSELRHQPASTATMPAGGAEREGADVRGTRGPIRRAAGASARASRRALRWAGPVLAVIAAAALVGACVAGWISA